MQTNSDIRYLPPGQIDRQKWDRCIHEAPNGLVYAYSFYLDHMSPGWEALVQGDYEGVMPLTGRKKFGIHYLAQPFLSAQLGVFGKEITPSRLDAFFQMIPAKFRYVDIYLNHGNVSGDTRQPLYLRSNFTLDLQKDYETLRAQYRENITRNLRRAEKAGCEKAELVSIDDVIALATHHMPNQTREIRENIHRFRELYNELQERKMTQCAGIRLGEKIVASAAFFYSHQRAYYILVGNHPDGRTLGASHALIDQFIREHAGQDLLLDFEGSDLRNLAFFYSSFGAKEEKYAGLKWNRLPYLMRLLKS